MNDPQGIATFPGVGAIESATMTFSHGIQPSVCTIVTTPASVSNPGDGTLQFEFGGVQIRFPDSTVVDPQVEVGESGQSVAMQIFDRRWKWRNGHINGHYNVRDDKGELIKDLEKSPQDLAKLLLEEMKEEGFDVSQLPNDPRPEALWDFANPAQELQNLCSRLGCRVVLQTDNRVKLCQQGEGADLPVGGVEMNAGVGFDARPKPDKLIIVGAPTLYQAKLLLEPVGEEIPKADEIDGEIKPIDELSYKPTAGWVGEDETYFGGVFGSPKSEYTKDGQTLYSADLALKSVWRWYRIKHEVSSSKLLFPKTAQPLKSIDQLLPLNDFQAEVGKSATGRLKYKKAVVQGVLALDKGMLVVGNTPSTYVYSKPFTIDAQRGLVFFSEPLFKLNSANKTDAADLYLTTSFSLRVPATNPPIRHTREKELPGPKRDAGAEIIRRPEIVRRVVARYSDLKVSGIFLNDAEFEKEADHHLEAAAKQFEVQSSADLTYAGIVPIELDGAIQQVTWSVGLGGATTRASRNAEHSDYVPPYPDRLRTGRFDDAFRKGAF